MTKETPCTRCHHKDVCMYKEDFIHYCQQIEKALLLPKNHEQGCAGVPIESIPFLSFSLVCMHHKPSHVNMREMREMLNL